MQSVPKGRVTTIGTTMLPETVISTEMETATMRETATAVPATAGGATNYDTTPKRPKEFTVQLGEIVDVNSAIFQDVDRVPPESTQGKPNSPLLKDGDQVPLPLVQQLALQPHQRTPIDADVLESKLKEAKYDPKATEYLVSGFRHGFDLGLDKPVSDLVRAREVARTKRRPRGDNHKSVSLNPLVVQEKLDEEVRAGRMIGPCHQPPYKDYVVSPLGLVRKKEKNKFRIIHDLSYPREGVSVNSCIPDEEGTVKYDDVAKAIRLIRQVGQGAVLVKTDIQHAYKLIPLKNTQIPAMGIKWNGEWYFDATLAMGSKSGCAIFERFASALQYLAEYAGCGPMCHLLDDFLLVTVDSAASEQALAKFLDLCKQLGVPVVMKKTEVGTCLVFLGIELDTVAMEARLPLDKLQRMVTLLSRYRKMKKLKIVQLQSLTGLLNFACAVVAPGKPFLRRLYQLTKGLHNPPPYYSIRLTSGAREDMKVWLHFLSKYNGVTMFLPTAQTLDYEAQVFVDSSTKGFGIVCGRRWTSGGWPDKWVEKLSAEVRYLYVLLVCMYIYGESLANLRLLVHVPFTRLVKVINTQTDKDPQIMTVVRDIVLCLLKFNIKLEAAHAIFPFNPAASLSQGAQPAFQSQRRDCEGKPTEIPSECMPESYDRIWTCCFPEP